MARPHEALPPEGLWVSPRGRKIPVVEHLLAIQQYPEEFGLKRRDVSGANIHGLRDIALDLIEGGWVRFRYLAGTYAFEIGEMSDRHMETIGSILIDAGAFKEERIAVSIMTPEAEHEGTVGAFWTRSLFRFQANPKRNRWRFS